jgi:dTDP-4-dehydrorhamnose reductase
MNLDRVLVTGGGGQLASDLERLLAPRCQGSAPARAELDITDDEALRRAFARLQPALVFNCAAFHNVDVCEREEDRAFAVNTLAVKRLAELCAAHRAKLVHLSTNYVFDGERSAPYDETDVPAPRSVYAITKLAGENAARAYAPGALVVRSAGLYGMHGSASKGGNFVTRMLAKAGEDRGVKMVADQRLSPTFTTHLARGLVEAVEAGATGVLHLTSSGACSWYEFTLAIMDIAGIETQVEPVKTSRNPGAADRPLNGVLRCQRAESLALSPLPAWLDALREYMQKAGLASSRGR